LAHCLFCSIVDDGWLWKVELKVCKCFKCIFVVPELEKYSVHVVIIKKTWQVVICLKSVVVFSYMAMHPGCSKKTVSILAKELLDVKIKAAIKDVLIVFVQ